MPRFYEREGILAEQFDGTSWGAKRVADLAGACVDVRVAPSDWNRDTIMTVVSSEQDPPMLTKGQWLVVHRDGREEVLTPQEFDTRYVAVEQPESKQEPVQTPRG